MKTKLSVYTYSKSMSAAFKPLQEQGFNQSDQGLIPHIIFLVFLGLIDLVPLKIVWGQIKLVNQINSVFIDVLIGRFEVIADCVKGSFREFYAFSVDSGLGIIFLHIVPGPSNDYLFQ